tara:strand:- start:156 stop:710 length:555 start_codon:yes stop_codon:yes gene_type:complete
MLTLKRKRKLIAYISEGMTNKKIAAEMGVCEKTIYNWKNKIDLQIDEETSLMLLRAACDDLIKKNDRYYSLMDEIETSPDDDIDVTKLSECQNYAMQNSLSLAKIMKSIGISKFQFQEKENMKLRKKLIEATEIIQLLKYNNDDLKEGDEEEYPEAYKRLEEFFASVEITDLLHDFEDFALRTN